MLKFMIEDQKMGHSPSAEGLNRSKIWANKLWALTSYWWNKAYDYVIAYIFIKTLSSSAWGAARHMLQL